MQLLLVQAVAMLSLTVRPRASKAASAGSRREMSSLRVKPRVSCASSTVRSRPEGHSQGRGGGKGEESPALHCTTYTPLQSFCDAAEGKIWAPAPSPPALEPLPCGPHLACR